MNAHTLHAPGRRPCQVERRTVGPRRLSEVSRANLLAAVSEALAPVLAQYPRHREEAGQVVVDVGAAEIKAASDGAGAESYLGKRRGTFTTLCPPREATAAGNAHFVALGRSSSTGEA